MEVPSPPPSCRRRGASCPSRRPRRPCGREAWTRGAAARSAQAAARAGRRHLSATCRRRRVRRRRRRWTGGAEGARPRTPDLSGEAGARRPRSATAEEAHLRSRRGAAELPNHQSLCEEEVHLRNHPDGEAVPNRRSGCAHRIRRPFWEHHHHQSRHRGARRRSRRGARRRHRIRRAGGRRRHRNRGAAEARRRAGRRRGASPTGRPGRRAVRHRPRRPPRPRPRVRRAGVQLQHDGAQSLLFAVPRRRRAAEEAQRAALGHLALVLAFLLGAQRVGGRLVGTFLRDNRQVSRNAVAVAAIEGISTRGRPHPPRERVPDHPSNPPCVYERGRPSGQWLLA